MVALFLLLRVVPQHVRPRLARSKSILHTASQERQQRRLRTLRRQRDSQITKQTQEKRSQQA